MKRILKSISGVVVSACLVFTLCPAPAIANSDPKTITNNDLAIVALDDYDDNGNNDDNNNDSSSSSSSTRKKQENKKITWKRLGGANRYDTNLLILQEAGVGNKDIIVCTGLNFADSLSASATGLPILLVKGGLTDSQKVFLASSSGKKIIVGGTAAVSASVESQLKAYGEVKRLAGNTRYDTSVLVAKEFFQNPTSAVLAYAKNFPDGLSGGPLAYTLNAPLILTDNSKPAAAVTYATGAGIKSGYALGGTGLISDKVVKNIFSMDEADAINVK
jgi:putative cell wall-binding protein